MLTSRGLGRVLGDLASMGFDARWGVLGAADVGANHQRDRIWIVAKQRHVFSYALHNGARWGEQQQASITQKNGITNTEQQGLERRSNSGKQEIAWAGSSGALGNTDSLRKLQPQRTQQDQWRWIGDTSWWEIEPNVGRVAEGVAARGDRLKAIGNGQVPLCAATAWRILSES